MRIGILLALWFIGLLSYAQSLETLPTVHKFGIKTSINISTLSGKEFQNPRAKFGYTAGAYFLSQKKKNWSIYSEVLGNFKGSNFSNGDTGYSRIALFYVDASVLPTYYLADDKSAISIGPYFSYLGLSSMFIKGQRKAEKHNLGLKSTDFGIAGYYLIKGPVVSFQVGSKLGLIDINNGVNFEGYFPKTGTGGVIRNISLEVGMLF